MSYINSAVYIATIVDSVIIRNGSNWEDWIIGVTNSPDEFEITLEASSSNEAKIAMDFIIERRKLAQAENIKGKFVYLKRKS